MDPNREVEIGAQCEEAEEAFNTYHDFLHTALQSLSKALLIDLHGRCKSDGITQLGYCIPKENLIKGNYDLKVSSLSNLSDQEEALRGIHSLGAFMENEGLQAVPSPSHPCPSKGKSKAIDIKV